MIRRREFMLAAGAALAAPAIGRAQEETGIILPRGFRATVFADNLGPTLRHVTVAENGVVYANCLNGRARGGIVALRDANGDGRADEIAWMGDHRGTGIEARGPWLYYSSEFEVFRQRLGRGLALEGARETIAGGFPRQRAHTAKSLAFDDQGFVYVNSGAPTNACERPLRTPGARGEEPCGDLQFAAGIWRFRADRLNQDQARDGHRFATGLRNCVALAWSSASRSPFVVMHGRDQLEEFWPALYDARTSAELPAEEMHALADGSDHGWPYTYWNHLTRQRVVGPEYGGDGTRVAPAGRFSDPVYAFPGHWAPNDLIFYGGTLFPQRYRGGAFIAFHGSWNRAPLPQRGYNVSFVPFANGRPAGPHEIFADGFAGRDEVLEPADARFRPMGLAEGRDGSLFIVDSQRGRVWRVTPA